MNYRNPALTKLAKGQRCTIRHSRFCNHDPSTTVWAHSNFQRHGKGRGIKAHDIFGCFACSGCHHWLDNVPAPRQEKLDVFTAAHEETLLILVTEGSLVVAGYRPRTAAPVTHSKIVPRGERIV